MRRSFAPPTAGTRRAEQLTMKNLRKLWVVVAIAAHGCAATDSLEVFDGDTGAPIDDQGGDEPKPGKNGEGPTKQSQQGLGEQLGLVQIMKLARDAGLPCENLVMAGAVAMAESGGWPGATNVNGSSGDCPSGSIDRGIWQINDCYWPQFDDTCAFEPACNAMAMATISGDGSSFSLWSSVTPDGTYASYLEPAQAALASVPGCGDSDPSGDPPGPGGSSEAECDELGYAGTCVDEVALWSDDGGCWVRDCVSEGKTCGLISASEGYGCVEGPDGSTKEACADLGYEGACYGDVLVWVEDGSCRYVDCAATGRDCIFAGGSIGYDCQ